MAGQADNKTFSIERIVLKDLSFETPLGHAVFIGSWRPEFDLTLDMQSVHLTGDSWELILRATVTATVEQGTAFVIEVQVSGVFDVPGLEEDALHRVLAVDAPNLIYPYLREAVDNVAARGGFPPVNLQRFDFAAQYDNRNDGS